MNRSSFNTSVDGDNALELETDSTADNDDRLRRRSEANQHIANYVNDQLERVRSHESVAVYEDEFEAQLDDK